MMFYLPQWHVVHVCVSETSTYITEQVDSNHTNVNVLHNAYVLYRQNIMYYITYVLKCIWFAPCNAPAGVLISGRISNMSHPIMHLTVLTVCDSITM